MIPKLILKHCQDKYGKDLPLPEGVDLSLPKKEAWQKTEHDLQKAYFGWLMSLPAQYKDIDVDQLRADLWLAHAIPNGGKRSISEAAAFVAEGVKSGIPDVFIPIPNESPGDFVAGLYIEFKKSGGKVSEGQRCFLNMLHEKGYRCFVINDLETAQNETMKYLELGW